MEVLNEDKIEQWIVRYLSIGKRGFCAKVNMSKIVQLILKRLKTGCQWQQLYVKEYIVMLIPEAINYLYASNTTNKQVLATNAKVRCKRYEIVLSVFIN